MGKIYIISPTTIATGGTELLQQLCYSMNKNNIETYMYYIEPYENSAVQKKFFNYYCNPYSETIDDNPENILIIPETCLWQLRNYKKCQKYVWWLSVDNYYGIYSNSSKFKFKIIDLIYSIKFYSCKHLVQSEYARIFLETKKHIKNNKIYYLSDYINNDYFLKNIDVDSENSFSGSDTTHSKKRENRILYNPRKGYEFTKLLIEQIKEYEWFPLQNLSNDEMRDIMQTSKVYVDFGNHPGKDRIPRETALCGCCVITGKRGAAANSIDVPIGDEFKFTDSPQSINAIHNKIKECMENYDVEKAKFDEYRNIILGEEEKFNSDILKIFKSKV